MSEGTMCTPAMQRYLAAIFRLQQATIPLTVSDLADQLGITLPAVSSMIHRLEADGLVQRTPQRTIMLTAKGEQRALPIVRRYLLAEVYLVDVMKFGWEDAHTLTPIFVQGINAMIEERVEELAGFPTHTRRGEPIPTRDGTLPVVDDRCLVELQSGEGGVISRVQVDDPDKLRYLDELNLVPNMPVTLVDAAPFEGPLTLQCGDQNCVLSYQMAQMIRVIPHGNEPSPHK